MDTVLREALKHELICEHYCEDQPKDILIVVHNGFEYIHECLESVYAATSNFDLYVWDNGSNSMTREFLQEFNAKGNFHYYRSEENLGFIRPNNKMAADTSSPYLILLNSDAEVQPGWDQAMIGYLQQHPEVALVGYMGGALTPDGWGYGKRCGSDVDYIEGWCMAFPRTVYNEHGLFDEENLQFAFFEDSDFSLRLREAGHKVYALHVDYVEHHQNATVSAVEDEMDLGPILQANNAYFCKRWAKFLPKL